MSADPHDSSTLELFEGFEREQYQIHEPRRPWGGARRIEHAKRDGTRYLLFVPPHWVIGHWFHDQARVPNWGWRSSGRFVEPTHYRPIPPDPRP